LALAVVEDDGDDDGQGQSFVGRLAFDVPLKDAQDVAQKPEWQQLVGRALVLERDVKEGWPVGELRGEKQVGLGASEGLVDEAGRAGGETRR
jgi:hypothetical protein